MDCLKVAVSEAPVLISVDYSPPAGPIVVYVDASTTIGWGAILSQIDNDECEHPVRFEARV
jgi:RNase H-like domain found in reverse transcriptase